MSGSNCGVTIKIASLERRALYTHCYGHALNLATQDALRIVKIMGDTLDQYCLWNYEVIIKKSPRQKAIFQKLKMMWQQSHQEYVFYVQLTGPFKP